MNGDLLENTQSHAEPPAREKAPYEPPHITFEDRLEVVAVVCSPSPPAKANPGSCSQGPISS